MESLVLIPHPINCELRNVCTAIILSLSESATYTASVLSVHVCTDLLYMSCCNDLKLTAKTCGAIASGFRFKSVNSTLVIVSPTINDTGEIVCNSNNPPLGHGKSLYIAVGKIFSITSCKTIVQISILLQYSRSYL